MISKNMEVKRIKDLHDGYVVISSHQYEKYKKYSYAPPNNVVRTLEEAEYLQLALERGNRIPYKIIKLGE